MQVIDELSTDATRESLTALGVTVIEAPSIQGVTANWNMVSVLLTRGSCDLDPDLILPINKITYITYFPGIEVIVPSSCNLTISPFTHLCDDTMVKIFQI